MANERTVAELVKERGILKSTFTRLSGLAKSQLETFDAQNEEQVATLAAYQRTLELKQNSIKDLDEQIFRIVDDDSMEKEDSDATDYSLFMTTTLIRIEKCLSKITQKDEDIVSAHSTRSPSVQSDQSSSFQRSVKLPKLEIKKFDGDPSNWTTFIDCFTSAIHENDELSNVQKMIYLQNLTTGPAAATIAGFSLSNNNYKEALEMLKQRFGDKQMLISTHMKALYQLKRVTSISDLHAIRKVYDIIEVKVRSLQNLGVDSKMYGSMLVPLLMEKIPEELRLLLTRRFKKDTYDINLVLDAFKDELEARERCGTSKSDNGHRKKPDPSSTGMALPALTDDAYKFSCVFCGGKHKHQSCTIVTDVESRKDILWDKNKCFKCLRSGHSAKRCRSNISCFKCQKHHHVAVCTLTKEAGGDDEEKDTSAMLIDTKKSILLQTAEAMVGATNGKQFIKKRILFDNGSQRTYITDELRRKLGLEVIGKETIFIKTFGSEEASSKTVDVVRLCVKSKDSSLNIYITALSVPIICTPVTSQNIQFAKSRFVHIRDLELAENSVSSEKNIDILVGSDFYWSFISGSVIKGEPGSPVALGSKLGYILSGPMSDSTKHQTSTNLAITHVLRVDNSNMNSFNLDREVENFFKLETIGISNEEDKQVCENLLDDIQFSEGRYEVKLPFKDSNPIIEDNYNLSSNRLKGLVKKLRKAELFERYDEIIINQLEEGIIEKADNRPEVGKVTYLPHRHILRENHESTPMRIVFDASARNKGPSLNSFLHTGPSLVPLLFSILLRFRSYAVALVADIEKAFLQISVHPDHRDFLRFLWFDDIHSEDLNVTAFRFTRILFGMNCSPFLMNGTIRHHVTKNYMESDPEFVRTFLESLYVDDLNSGGNDEVDTYELFKKSKIRLAEGGFNLRKFKSNSYDLLKSINSTCNDPVLSTADFERDDKVLGLIWNKKRDVFIFYMSEISKRMLEIPTKRDVISLLASIFDPLVLCHQLL